MAIFRSQPVSHIFAVTPGQRTRGITVSPINVSPINEKSTMNAFVSYFNRRSALKAAIKNHHEIFENAEGTDEELDNLAGGISLGYTLVKDRKGSGYTLFFTTSDVERSNLILTSTIEEIENTIRDEIRNTLVTAKRQILLDQTTRRERLQRLIRERRNQLILQQNDHIRELEEHAALARHLGIEGRTRRYWQRTKIIIGTSVRGLPISAGHCNKVATLPAWLQSH